MRWALDLGTTNTAVARWEPATRQPALVELPAVCRRPEGDEPLEAPRLVPSAVEVLTNPSLAARASGWPWLAGRVFWGRLGTIGRAALEVRGGAPPASVIQRFKGPLGASPYRVLGRARGGAGRAVVAREAARVYLRELLAEVYRATGERVRELVVTAPVDAYESYRAELAALLRRLGVRRVRFVDEPVAAALGYGLALKARRLVLVVDFGGGTLDLALVELTAAGVEAGTAEVVAKEGRPVGGDDVDRWLVEQLAAHQDLALPPLGGGPHEPHQTHEPQDTTELDEDATFWLHTLLAEAQRVKEAVHFREEEIFLVTPPEELRRFDARLRGEAPPLRVSRASLRALLARRGLFDLLGEALEGVARQAAQRGRALDDVEDVLLVGGSTLLPGFYKIVEERFGRDRVRAWQPFEAVAFGAAAFAGRDLLRADFIVHDYALVTHDRRTHAPQQTIIVPRGTRFPTAPDLWKRRLVPTCSTGAPESLFKLVISEVGRAFGGGRRFGWDARGELHKLGGRGAGAEDLLVVPLNEADPTLGTLRPPQDPEDASPRLEVSFGVNADRWLVATVLDLKTGRTLMDQEPVVRLL